MSLWKFKCPKYIKLFISAMGVVDNKKSTKKLHTCFITNVILIYLYFCIFLLPVMENKCLWQDWWYQIKHLATYASLQQAAKCQILTQKDLYKFEIEQLPGFKCFYVSSEIFFRTAFSGQQNSSWCTILSLFSSYS